MASAIVKMYNHAERCGPLKAALRFERPTAASPAAPRTQARYSHSVLAPPPPPLYVVTYIAVSLQMPVTPFQNKPSTKDV